MRRAARTDRNHKEIVRTFRAMGCTVADTSALGDGFPDLVVGCVGHTLLVEVKDGDKSPSAQALTDAQIQFADRWRGGDVHVVNSPIQAQLLIERFRDLIANKPKPLVTMVNLGNNEYPKIAQCEITYQGIQIPCNDWMTIRVAGESVSRVVHRTAMENNKQIK